MVPADEILGAERLTAVFGYWPTFHDAEVVWMRLDRGGTDLGPGPTLDALIHAFEMTKEVDAAGYYVLRNHVLVHLRFAGVSNLRLDGFNQQNAIFGLTISMAETGEVGEKYQVGFDPSFGVGAEFHCATIAVSGVQPCDKDGNPLPASNSR